MYKKAQRRAEKANVNKVGWRNVSGLDKIGDEPSIRTSYNMEGGDLNELSDDVSIQNGPDVRFITPQPTSKKALTSSVSNMTVKTKKIKLGLCGSIYLFFGSWWNGVISSLQIACKTKKQKQTQKIQNADSSTVDEDDTYWCCFSKFTSHMIEIYEKTCDFADNQFDLYNI